MTDPAVAVCIPTLNRPAAIERMLENLAEQELAPGVVLVVDASEDDATEHVCHQMAGRFADGVVRHERWSRGLTLQRRRGIDVLQKDPRIRYLCMLDDDVTLAPDFLTRMVGFLSSEAGRRYGGVSGYDLQGWGRPFERLEHTYARLGLFGGELRPGRWLYCGRFLELSRLSVFAGVHDSDFIGGGLVVWRMEVFDRFLPPLALAGYALLEDKHFSLRVASAYRLGVLGDARLWHDRVEGGRPRRVAMGYVQIRHEALMLRDCDPAPTVRRYLAFLGFTLVDLLVRTVLSVMTLRPRNLPRILGQGAGWVSCVLAPPRPTQDALTRRGKRT